MMALSLFTIPSPTLAASPTAPIVVDATGAFDLLMPLADPAGPRHEPAPTGNDSGKDPPPAESNPLAWLLPSVAPVAPPPVSAPTGSVDTTRAIAVPLSSADIPAARCIAPTVSPVLPTAVDEATGSPPPAATAIVTGAPIQVVPPIAPLLSRLSEDATMRLAPSPDDASGATARPPGPRIVRNSPKPADRADHFTSPVAVGGATIATLATAPRIAPAAQVFAAAIGRVERDDRVTGPLDAAAAASTVATTAVAATADAQHAALDLRQEQWPTRMIERIEVLRDAANAQDASIRLIPDALGTIDVSLRQDGDTVHVQFDARVAETRQLLAEAAPRLTELAEARGLKLSQNGADTAGQQPRQQPTPPTAAKPRGARVDDTESTDTRIA